MPEGHEGVRTTDVLPWCCPEGVWLAHWATNSLPRQFALQQLRGADATRCFGQATCANCPAGFVPFSSIIYVTAADAAGDHLVVGVPAPGAVNMIVSLPQPAFINQMFCDAEVQLVPQQRHQARSLR